MASRQPPAPVGRGLRAMFEVRSVPRRWPRALRAAVCMGVPVHRENLTDDQAFDLLIRTSQRANIKILDIATWLVDEANEAAH